MVISSCSMSPMAGKSNRDKDDTFTPTRPSREKVTAPDSAGTVTAGSDGGSGTAQSLIDTRSTESSSVFSDPSTSRSMLTSPPATRSRPATDTPMAGSADAFRWNGPRLRDALTFSRQRVSTEPHFERSS